MKDLKKYSTVLIIVLIALLVTGIGALAGWLLVLNANGQTISFESAMRGLGIGSPKAGANGSNYDNMEGAGTGGFSAGGTGDTASNIYGNGAAPGTLVTPGAGGAPIANGSLDAGAGTNTSSTSVSLTYGSSTQPTVVVPKTPRLWHISKTPVAGFSFATSSPSIWYAERATGYVFKADTISGDVLRKTNTLMPKIYEAFLMHDGSVLYRSLSSNTGAILTFSGQIGSSTSANTGSLIGVNLPNNIVAMDANADAKNMFYLTEDSGTFTGFTAQWVAGKFGKTKQIFTSTIGSWKPILLSDGRTLILEKPQDDAAGYAYEVASDGTMKPLLRAVPGLTFLPLSNTSAYVYGASANDSLTMYAQTSTTTYALPVKTVADKCVWASYHAATKKIPASDLVVYCAVPDSANVKNFLKDWYMGVLHTSDSWWRMNLTTGKSEQILSSATGGANIDVIDPQIDPTGNFLGFKNNADGSLWVLRINK